MYGPIQFWDVSAITDMSGLFQGCADDHGADLSLWDVRKVTSMEYMFDGATAFNCNLSTFIRNISTFLRCFNHFYRFFNVDFC